MEIKWDDSQECLINLAIKDKAIAAKVLDRRSDFNDQYQLILKALSEGFAASRITYNAWLDTQLVIPADRAGNMNIYNRISIKIAKPADVPGLFIHLDQNAAKNKKQVAIRKFKNGDAAAIEDLEGLGIDVTQLRSTFIANRLKDKSYETSDIGNGELFADAYADDLRYVSEWKRWLHWSGKRWEPINPERVHIYAQELIRHVMPILATMMKDDERRAKYLKHTAASSAIFKVNAMIEAAKGRMCISVNMLDANPMLFNVQNGTLNCETGEIRSHNRLDYLTKISPCHYDPKATCPNWEKFVTRIIVNTRGHTDTNMLDYLQTVIGYSITGSVREECMFVLWGKGGTGKSTLTETLLYCMGDYGLTLATSVLLDNQTTGNNDNVADLCGVRCAIANETKAGGRFNEERVKAITGGDRMTAMRKYERPFQFTPQHKVWLACNDRPKVSATDDGMWRRLRLIPFLAEIPASEKDLTLKSKLKSQSEINGILNWMIAGLKRWLSNGLSIPKEVETATAAYRADSDVFGQFLAENCVISENAKVKAGDLFRSYQYWAEENGLSYPMTSVGMKSALLTRGIKHDKRADANYFMGIGLQQDENPDVYDSRNF